jgi:polyisoprenyl-phosphate glycosyltransferase
VPAPATLSIVVPVYNEEAAIAHSHEELLRSLRAPGFGEFERIEIVYVDDGSTDGTSSLLRRIRNAPESVRIQVLQFSRNFGHSAAVFAGLDAASGEYVAILDADLQDPPALLAEMYAELKGGYDVVYGQRSRREGDAWFKRSTAWAFYRVLQFLTGANIPADTGDFRIMTREVRDAVISCTEQQPFLRGLVAWVGFRQKAFPYLRRERAHGTSKYPFRKMLGFAINAILSFSSLPLRLAIYAGFVGLLGSLAISGWVVVQYLRHQVIHGWTSVLLGYLYGQSVTLMTIGFIGLYVGQIENQTKGRPRYILRKDGP